MSEKKKQTSKLAGSCATKGIHRSHSHSALKEVLNVDRSISSFLVVVGLLLTFGPRNFPRCFRLSCGLLPSPPAAENRSSFPSLATPSLAKALRPCVGDDVPHRPCGASLQIPHPQPHFSPALDPETRRLRVVR